MSLMNAAALLTKPLRLELEFERAEPTDRPAPRYPRVHLVERILELNPTATPEFLSRFNLPLLEEYLEHLTLTQSRGRGSGWIRKDGAPAIVMRASRA